MSLDSRLKSKEVIAVYTRHAKFEYHNSKLI